MISIYTKLGKNCQFPEFKYRIAVQCTLYNQGFGSVKLYKKCSLLYYTQCWGACTFFHQLPLKKGPAPGRCFYKFLLIAPTPSKKARLPGAVFRGIYRLRLPIIFQHCYRVLAICLPEFYHQKRS